MFAVTCPAGAERGGGLSLELGGWDVDEGAVEAFGVDQWTQPSVANMRSSIVLAVG